MKILGVSCFYHDSSAALLVDGDLIATAPEEAFSRIKHDADFPTGSIQFCLETGGLKPNDLDYIVFYDKPLVKFERLLKSAVAGWPSSFVPFMKSMPIWLNQKLWMRQEFEDRLGYEGPILFSEHHLSHAAAAFYASPFEEAALLTVDGVGEWTTTAKGVGRGTKIELSHEIRFPHSLGMLYSAFTHYLGFKVNSAEYKVMGLAPYGEPTYRKQFAEVVQIKDDGSFRLNMKYFDYDRRLQMTNSHLWALFGGPPRLDTEPLTQRHKDIAASLQKVIDEAMVKLATSVVKETGLKKLVLAGGVALNCVANGFILRETPVEEIFVVPAASDSGSAAGAAWYIHHHVLGHPRTFGFRKPYLGPGFSDDQIEATLKEMGAVYHGMSRDDLLAYTARLIEEQQVIGWFQGRLEFGPRALGNRSILGDARSPAMRDTMNLKIKFRESFRPFAPTVLREYCSEWFELEGESPYMLLVAQVRPDKRTLPAVTHVDGSARIQTLTREDNPLYYDLIEQFRQRTGCPVVINTSFNVRGEPIVCTPREAYECFMRTNMDHLVIGSFVMDKKEQPALKGLKSAQEAFAPD